LRRHHRIQAERRLVLGLAWRDLDLIFDRGDGGPVNPNWLTDRFGQLGRSQGFPRVRFHDLRHGHATLMLAEGIHPKVVSERLGHAGVGITLDTYSHVLPSLQAEAARVLDSVLGPSPRDATVAKLFAKRRL